MIREPRRRGPQNSRTGPIMRRTTQKPFLIQGPAGFYPLNGGTLQRQLRACSLKTTSEEEGTVYTCTRFDVCVTPTAAGLQTE
ncbi:hypothetical protein BaRGS_00024108 [Batillaria attramentaria]|uniref:Uncharacterized protein n=1 Tax=Batillaria attramentaria TaxID=370345 RepID=A0ABD0KCI7_9CAEN